MPVPGQFRDTGPEQPASPESLADVKWFDLFQDDVLKQLVSTALDQNFDLRVAAARVLQARAQLGVSRSYQYPTIDVAGDFVASRTSTVGSIIFIPRGTNLDVSYTQAGFRLGWELDVWGRLRRLTEAASAEYLASEEARRGVITTLVSDVTSRYFVVRQLDLELEIGRKTRAAAEDGLRLTRLRHDQGVATGLDVRQAEQLLYTATAQIASTEREIALNRERAQPAAGQEPGRDPARKDSRGTQGAASGAARIALGAARAPA